MARQAYHQVETVAGGEGDLDDVEEDELTNPRDVGHNIYILAHQLARHNKELQDLLKPPLPGDGMGAASGVDQALDYYAKHTAQIEVRNLP